MTLPLLAWAEFNLYHKTANKKRVKEVMPMLSKHYKWLEANFKMPNGLFATPLSSTGMENTPRTDVRYFIDFHAAMAMNALYLSALGDILNDKDASFQYKRDYFSIKTRINSKMWNAEDGFYYDLGEHENQIPTKTLGTYWLLLAEIPNEERAEKLVAKLKDPQCFGTENPFPSLSADHPAFDKKGQGFRGSVFPWLTFMVIKGMEKYYFYELARDSAIRHLYYILDSMHSNEHEGNRHNNHPTVWSAYQPMNEEKQSGMGILSGRCKTTSLQMGSHSDIVIENVIGLYISLPRKTVDWIIPNLEVMVSKTSPLSAHDYHPFGKSGRGWEIHMESEKLYFYYQCTGKKEKTLPIPSGKCSMLIEKFKLQWARLRNDALSLRRTPDLLNSNLLLYQ